MAVKSKKKPARTARKSSARRAGAKPSAKPAARKKTSRPQARVARHEPNPAPVSTGPGASPLELGRDLVSKFNAGQFDQLEGAGWSPELVSVEGYGMNQAWKGRKAVNEKNAWWAGDHTVHGASAQGPFVGSTGFAVKFRMDVETKSTGKRETMEEIGVYTVLNGKIVREEFMYGL